MAQIYEEQVRVNRDPMAPDTGLMDYFEKGRKDAIGTIDHNITVEFERRETQKQSLKDLTLMQAKQVYQNAATLYNNDTKKYSEVVTKGLETIYKAVPDGPEKINIMAEVSIFGSGYDTKVKRGELDKQENIWKTRQRDLTMQSSDAAINLIGSTLLPADINSGKLTEQEYLTAAQSYRDSELQLKKSYEQRYMTDRNGNPIFSDSERALLEDRWTNRGYYAFIGSAQQNVQSNYNNVKDNLDWLKSNKDLAKQRYGVDDKAYVKTINSLENILTGQITPQQELQNTYAITTDKGAFESLQLEVDKKGEVIVKNKNKRNLNALADVYNQLESNENAYIGANEPKYYKQLATVGQAMIDAVEKDVGLTKRDQFVFGKNERPGYVAMSQVNENLNNVIDSLGVTDKDQITLIKAKMYKDTLVNLKVKNIDLTGKSDPNTLKEVRKVANAVYTDYVTSVVGNVPLKEGEDPKLVLDNALLQYKNNKSVANIQSQIGAQGSW